MFLYHKGWEVRGCKCPRFCLDRNTEPASVPAATVCTCPNSNVPHDCTLPQETLLWLFKGRISKTESLIKRKKAHYFFKLCSFSMNPVLLVLYNPEQTADKCPMSLPTKGARETSLWNHQKLKKYVCNILLPSVIPSAAKPTQSGQGVPGVVQLCRVLLLCTLSPLELRGTSIVMDETPA